MSSEESFLHVRASVPGKTYVGGTFCRSEIGMLEIYEQAATDTVLDITSARNAVQTGMTPEAAIRTFNLDRTTSGSRDIGSTVMACLNRIAGGLCAVHPISEGNK